MKFNFTINKYFLIWNILYQNSISEDLQKLKQKLWNNYKKEYSSLHYEKEKILKELNDYIPDDDYLFNLVESSDGYKKIKTETTKYRLLLLEIWTTCSRKINRNLNKILKYDLDKNFEILVLHPNFDIIDMDFNLNEIQLGKKTTLKDKDSFITYLCYKILENELSEIKKYDEDIYTVILELVCVNELYSKITNVSKYNTGQKQLRILKNKIYPYWLMYLGVEEKNFEKFMVRDNLFFDTEKYKYVEELKEFDIFSFSNFIIKNKEEILNKKNIGVNKVKIETL